MHLKVESDATNVNELIQIRSLTLCSNGFIIGADTFRLRYNRPLCVLGTFLTTIFIDYEASSS
jgi:hypothetical protein